MDITGWILVTGGSSSRKACLAFPTASMTLNEATRWFDSFLLLNPEIVYFVALHHSHNGPDVAIRAAHLAEQILGTGPCRCSSPVRS